MVKRLFLCFMAAVTALSVLLCGCGEESREDVILIGSTGADVYSGSEREGAGHSDTGTPWQPGSAQPSASGTPGNPQAGNPDPETPMIRVYVCGAVVCPGVVEIPQGSRIEEALSAAGGFLPEAFTEAVNLADWVVDGQMLYFPTEEEGEAWKPVQGIPGSQDGHAQVEQGKLVDINTASEALLCTLPGIGEAKAADIIAYRETHGSFASCEDIMKVPGIKTNIYEKICDKITVKQ